jgi:hypothetical protein
LLGTIAISISREGERIVIKSALLLSLLSAGIALPAFVSSPAIKNQTPPDTSYVREEKNLLMGMYGGGIEFSYAESQIQNATWASITTSTYYFSDTGIVNYGDDTSGGVIKIPASMPTTIDWSNYVGVQFLLSKFWNAGGNWGFTIGVNVTLVSTIKNDVYCDFTLTGDVSSSPSVTQNGNPVFISSVNTSFPQVYYFDLNVNQDPSFADGFSFQMQGMCGYNLENRLYNEGYFGGYDSGYSDGVAVGYQTGYNSGYADGNSVGYSNGYDSGYSDGQVYIHADSPYFPFLQAMSVIQSFLALPVFGAFNLGELLGGMIALSVLVMFLSWFKG